MVERVGDGDVGRRPKAAGRGTTEVFGKFLFQLQQHALAHRRRRVLEVPGGDLAETAAQQGAVHSGSVLEPASGRIVLAQANAGGSLHELGHSARREEQLGADRATEEHVVVGVQKVLGEAGNVVQLAFHGVRIVNGQHAGVNKEVFAAHNRHTRVLREPLRGGRIGRDEDAPNPRGEHVDTSQGVLQLVDLAKAGIRIVTLNHHVGLHALGAFALKLVA